MVRQHSVDEYKALSVLSGVRYITDVAPPRLKSKK